MLHKKLSRELDIEMINTNYLIIWVVVTTQVNNKLTSTVTVTS